jgi:hypothetical protein
VNLANEVVKSEAKPVAKKKRGGIQPGAGRPLKEIDPKMVFELASIDCTDSEIAKCFGCNESTIKDRFSTLLREGRAAGCRSMKRKMHEVAYSGDTKMLIWLSKQRLGYKENQPEAAQHIYFNVMVNEVPR